MNPSIFAMATSHRELVNAWRVLYDAVELLQPGAADALMVEAREGSRLMSFAEIQAWFEVKFNGTASALIRAGKFFAMYTVYALYLVYHENQNALIRDNDQRTIITALVRTPDFCAPYENHSRINVPKSRSVVDDVFSTKGC